MAACNNLSRRGSTHGQLHYFGLEEANTAPRLDRGHFEMFQWLFCGAAGSGTHEGSTHQCLT